MVFVIVYARWKGYGKDDHEGRLPFLVAPRGKAALALLMPVIILGGIYGGVFTPTEASVVAVFYALIVGVLVYRETKVSDLPQVLRKSVVSSAVILFIIANAGLFSYLITRAGVPDKIGALLVDVLQSPALFLLGVNIALFVIGMFIETSASIIVLAPILAPVAQHFGIDPVHFGIIMVVNLALGMITPPFGVNLFAACTVARISLDQIVDAADPVRAGDLRLPDAHHLPAVDFTGHCATWSTPDDRAGRARPLAGLRVLEMGALIAGPFCAKILAEFGADVVKLEPPGHGDPLRKWRYVKDGTSVWWHVQSRNKRSVTRRPPHRRRPGDRARAGRTCRHRRREFPPRHARGVGAWPTTRWRR